MDPLTNAFAEASMRARSFARSMGIGGGLRNVSKYWPHQGDREKARRVRQSLRSTGRRARHREWAMARGWTHCDCDGCKN